MSSDSIFREEILNKYFFSFFNILILKLEKII
jgi:hypothetical protein